MSNKTSKVIKRFYHASPYRLIYGTILRPGLKPINFNPDVYYQDGIFISVEPNPHYTVRDKANKDGWYIYEIEPIGVIKLGDWYDLVCDRAKVIKFVCNARGLINHYKKGSKYRGGCPYVIKSGKYYRHPNVYRKYFIPKEYENDYIKVKEEINNPSSERLRLYQQLGIKTNKSV